MMYFSLVPSSEMINYRNITFFMKGVHFMNFDFRPGCKIICLFPVYNFVNPSMSLLFLNKKT